MTRFIVAPDGHGEPCVFAADQFSLEHRTMVPVAVLRRCDLDPRVRRFWDEIVERVTENAPTAGEIDYVGLQADLDELEAENPAVAAAAQRLARATQRIVADRRDRDELTDRDDLTQVIHDAVCVAGVHCRKPREIHYNTEDPQRIAEAVLAAGWIHWPHECGPEAAKNEQWQRSEGFDAGYVAGYRAAVASRFTGPHP